MEKTEKLTTLSARERAARIVVMITDEIPVLTSNRKRILQEQITSEIREAEREARRDAVIEFCEGDRSKLAEYEQAAYAKGYKAGAEAMRESCIHIVAEYDAAYTEEEVLEKLRALPLPSDTTPGDCICPPLSQPRTDCPFHGKTGKE